MPTFDVLAYPSHFDGLPLTVLEAMANGVPVVVSDYFALPEILGPRNMAGRVVPEGDERALAQAVCELLDPNERSKASEAALARYANSYSPLAAGIALRRAYDAAISG